MKVGLVGFGRAGRAVASVLILSEKTDLQWVVRRSHTLEHRSVPEFLGVPSDEPGLILSTEEFTADELLTRHPVDVIIDFSSPTGLDYYGRAAAARGVTIVTAASNYPPEKLAQLRELSKLTTVLYSPNITLGVNFLMIAAKILQNIAPYTDIEVIEEHFKAKVEVSGTAKLMAEKLGLPIDSIKSVRAGGIVGVHEVLFGFPHQTVRLRHESISREAFGNGALFAAINLEGKANGFYTMEDLFLPFFRLQESEAEILKAGKTPWWRLSPKRQA
jgi:4-hydroxy-tetrahydrodipicolinate reductase